MQGENSLLNPDLQMNYMVPLIIFLMIKAAQMSMHLHAVMKKKTKLLSLNGTFFPAR